MSTFDYTIPSDLMIKNYNNRVNKLSSGKVNVIRSWKNPVGTGITNVEFTMANKTKSIIPIKRFDISTLIPKNEDGYLVLLKSDVDAMADAVVGGKAAMREKLLLASNLDPTSWWVYTITELLWVMYGVFLPPTDYVTTNVFSSADEEDWLAQTTTYDRTVSSMTLVTMKPSSLGFTGQLKIILISDYPYPQNNVRYLEYIENNGSTWNISHPLASQGMDAIKEEILELVTKVDAFDREGQSISTLDELDLNIDFVNNDTGGTISVTSNDDRATGTLTINVFQSTENTIDLSTITNIDTPGLVELNQPDYQIYNDVNDNSPRAVYLFQQWIKDTYPDWSGYYSYVKPTLVTRTGDTTIEVVFYPSGSHVIGTVTVIFNFNNALHLSEITNVDNPGVWEITDPNAVTNAYDWQDAMDELTQHIASQISSQLQISSINASVFKATPQPNSDTPDGIASVILTPSETIAADAVFFSDGELLVTYPDVGYVPKKEVNLSLVSNVNEPGIWEIEATSLEDFENKVRLQKANIISTIFKDAGYVPSEWDISVAKSFNSYRMSGTNSAPLIKGELKIYPYIK